jgi:uncharacterized protein (DUF488 family)
MNATLYTIGHSTHSTERFSQLLHQHGISAIADVRSRPYSRMNPQFNREILKSTLKMARIAYAFFGETLGARTDDQSCYVDGRVQYERLAQTELFKSGLDHILDRVPVHRIALMCAEKDPITCHRMILVCHSLRRLPIVIFHIAAVGHLESNKSAENRLVKTTGVPESDLFLSEDELIEEAYRRQAKKIAWIETPGENVDEIYGFADVESLP